MSDTTPSVPPQTLSETIAIDAAIAEAEAEYAENGQLYDAAAILPALKRKHFKQFHTVLVFSQSPGLSSQLGSFPYSLQ